MMILRWVLSANGSLLSTEASLLSWKSALGRGKAARNVSLLSSLRARPLGVTQLISVWLSVLIIKMKTVAYWLPQLLLRIQLHRALGTAPQLITLPLRSRSASSCFLIFYPQEACSRILWSLVVGHHLVCHFVENSS